MHFLAFCFHCQVLLINAVKDVASALSDLILATKNASGKSSHDPTMTSLKDTAKVWIASCVVVLCVECLQWRFHAGAGGGAQAPKSWLPRNLAILLTHCGQLIVRKISKFDATRCQILRLKFTKFDSPNPVGGPYSTPPYPIAVFKGAYF